jgi:vacuolar-type H+-ATPase subunit C/Vma6
MELLKIPDHRGYPAEYLIARIRGRRLHLIRDWDRIVYSSRLSEHLASTGYGKLLSRYAEDGVWIRLAQEYQWLYFQMNRELRNIFRPFFLYHEIRTVMFCLRYKLGEDTGTDREMLLHFSLLSEKIKKLLMMDSDLPSTLRSLDRLYVSPGDRKSRTADVFSDEGLQGVEQKLTGICLKKIMRAGLHPLMKIFFADLIDSVNIMTAYKRIRWDIKAEPLFIEGGSCSAARLKRLVRSGRTRDITSFTERSTGLNIKDATASDIERTFQKRLLKRSRTMSRETSGIGFILDHLWQCYNEARNLSIILHGRDIDREVLKEELAV